MQILKATLFTFALAITAAISGCSNQQQKAAQEQPVENIFPKGEKITNNNFVGTAYLHMMVANDTALHASIGHVTFEPGARTNWHLHPGGQILLITEGKGYYQAKDEPARLLHKGDYVEIPRNIVHWHGAAPDSKFAHIAVSLNSDDGGAVWLGLVTEEEYRQSTAVKNL